MFPCNQNQLKILPIISFSLVSSALSSSGRNINILSNIIRARGVISMSVTYCLTSTDTHDYVIWHEMYVKKGQGIICKTAYMTQHCDSFPPQNMSDQQDFYHIHV